MSSPLKGAVILAMDKAWDKFKKRMHLSPKNLSIASTSKEMHKKSRKFKL